MCKKHVCVCSSRITYGTLNDKSLFCLKTYVCKWKVTKRIWKCFTYTIWLRCKENIQYMYSGAPTHINYVCLLWWFLCEIKGHCNVHENQYNVIDILLQGLDSYPLPETATKYSDVFCDIHSSFAHWNDDINRRIVNLPGIWENLFLYKCFSKIVIYVF